VGKASPAAIVSYYLDVASSVDLSIIVQDDPVHLGVGVSTATVVQLATSQPNIRYVKLEELPSMAKIRAVRSATNDGIGCLGGSGGVYILEELEAGAIGIMTGFALPEALVSIYAAWQEGNQERARELFQQVSNLVRLEALPGLSLAIRKRLYQARGAMASARLRSPAVDVDDWTWSLVAREWAAVAPLVEQQHALT
jgi:4-hydroxy-tetrahydrodipicolinate synthase